MANRIPSAYSLLAPKLGKQTAQAMQQGQQQPPQYAMIQPTGNGQAGSYLQFTGASIPGIGRGGPQFAPPMPAGPSQQQGPQSQLPPAGVGLGASVERKEPQYFGGWNTAADDKSVGGRTSRDNYQGEHRPSGPYEQYDSPTTVNNQLGYAGNMKANDLGDIRIEGTPTAVAETGADSWIEDLKDKINSQDNWNAIQEDVNAQRDAQLRAMYEHAASRGMAESGAASGMAGDIYRASARDLAKAHLAYQQQQIDNMKDVAGMLLGDKWNQLDQNFQREMAEWMLENQADLYAWIQSGGYQRESLVDYIERMKKSKYGTHLGTGTPETDQARKEWQDAAAFLGSGSAGSGESYPF